MKKIIALVSLTVALIGGFAFVPHSVEKTHVADPGGGRPPTVTPTIIAPAEPVDPTL